MAGTLQVGKVTDGTNEATPELLAKGTAKAWVNFNGKNTVAINASYNVSSITDNGTGDYTVNFATAFSDINYSFVFGAHRGNPTYCYIALGAKNGVTPTTTQLRICAFDLDNAVQDTLITNVAIFR